jgi:hypothetical protein
MLGMKNYQLKITKHARLSAHPGLFNFAFLIFNLIVAVALLPTPAFGQGAQGAQIKQRAKELVNQNNVRQGIPPPAAPPTPATPGSPTAPNAAVVQVQNIAKIKADLAAFKPGPPVTLEQKQQLIKDLAIAARSTKPSLPSVTKFVDTLAAALGENILGEPEQERLAQNLNSVFNSKPLPGSQFDKLIADVQAILQVGGVKRPVAASIAGDLKTVGVEVRR